MAAPPLDSHCCRHSHSRPLDWGTKVGDFLRDLGALSRSLSAVARRDADFSHRHRHRTPCRPDRSDAGDLVREVAPGRNYRDFHARCDAGDAPYGLLGPGGHLVRLRQGSGPDCNSHFRHAAHGKVCGSRHSHCATGGHRGRTNGRLHHGSAVVESRATRG